MMVLIKLENWSQYYFAGVSLRMVGLGLFLVSLPKSESQLLPKHFHLQVVLLHYLTCGAIPFCDSLEISR
jgi:hypothetical protein